MTFKLNFFFNSQKNSQIMFQIFVFEQKVHGKKQCYVLETFYKCNEIINFKIKNI
jgi:hypothetical protein